MKYRLKKYIAELVATAIYIFIGCGTGLMLGIDYKHGTAHLLVALAFGMSMVALYYAFSRISGCHMNPAVSLSALIAGRIDFIDFLFYTLFQIGGAFIGTALLIPLNWGNTRNFFANVYYDESVYLTLLVETLLSFIFVIVFLLSTKKQSGASAIVIGCAITAVSIIGIQLTGTAVNPAKAVASAVLAGGESLERLPVFIAAPFLGGAIAALLYIYFTGRDKREKKNKYTQNPQSADGNGENN